MRVEQHLKATLRELAGQMRGVDELAATAMSAGLRMRRRRRLAVAGGAVAVMLVALVPFALKQPPSQQVAVSPSPSASSAPATPSSAPGGAPLSETNPPALTGGWVLAGIGDLILNRDNNTYHHLRTADPNARYFAAPAGNLAAIVSQDSDANQDRIEFVTTAGKPVRTVAINTTNGSYQWSPQGDRLLTGVWGPKDDAPTNLSFAVINARTGEITTHRVDLRRYDCSLCQFAWSRDGREVGLGLAARTGGEASEAFKGVQFFDAATGAPTREVPMRAMFTGPFSWSPSGRYVIAQAEGLKREFQLIDTTDMRARPFPFDGVFVREDTVLGLGGSAIVAARLDGTIVERFELSGELKGIAMTVTLGPPS